MQPFLSLDYQAIHDHFTSPEKALALIDARRQNPQLLERVSSYLNDDIPDAFSGTDPVFYLPRHLATPSFETLSVMELAKTHGLDLVIGEDTRGVFVTNNELKLPLGKLPVVVGRNKNNEDIIQNKTIVDLSASQGRPMSEIVTRFGMPLPSFHAYLFSNWKTDGVITVDESNWIDRNFRDNIIEQYKRTLAMACTHMIMIEWYTPPEFQFGRDVFIPAFETVSREIGVKPLIVELMTPERDSEKNWNAYPKEVNYLIEQLERRGHDGASLGNQP